MGGLQQPLEVSSMLRQLCQFFIRVLYGNKICCSSSPRSIFFCFSVVRLLVVRGGSVLLFSCSACFSSCMVRHFCSLFLFSLPWRWHHIRFAGVMPSWGCSCSCLSMRRTCCGKPLSISMISLCSSIRQGDLADLMRRL